MQKKNTFLRIASVLLVVALFAGCILSGTTTLAKYTAAASGTALADVAKWSIKVKEYYADVQSDTAPFWAHAAGCPKDGTFTGDLDVLGTKPTCSKCDIEAVMMTNPIVGTPAQWREIATGKKEADLSINLFETVKCTGGELATTADTTIKTVAGSGAETHVKEFMIAPGTWGDFADIEVWNTSDVVADIYVNIKFTVNTPLLNDAPVPETSGGTVGVVNPYYRTFELAANGLRDLVLGRLKFFTTDTVMNAAIALATPSTTGEFAFDSNQTISLLFENVAPGDKTSDPAYTPKINGAAAVDGVYWLWSYDDGTNPTGADPLGFKAAAILADGTAGYSTDNVIGIAARLLDEETTARPLIKADVSVFAVQVN